MPLSERNRISNFSEETPFEEYIQEIGVALRRIVEEANIDNRVTVGVYPCADDLQRCPEQVMLCLLPDSESYRDVTVDIEHTLIEAHCLENDVRVIKVENVRALTGIFHPHGLRKADLSCILIKYPTDMDAICDEWQLVEDFCNQMLYYDVSQLSGVRIPD